MSNGLHRAKPVHKLA